MAIKYVQILNSNKEDKKYVAMFYDENKNYIKKLILGQKTVSLTTCIKMMIPKRTG